MLLKGLKFIDGPRSRLSRDRSQAAHRVSIHLIRSATSCASELSCPTVHFGLQHYDIELQVGRIGFILDVTTTSYTLARRLAGHSFAICRTRGSMSQIR
jgi:hypothetical protein